MPANAILPDKGEMALLKEGTAIDFLRAAFSHLETLPVDQMLLKKANVGQDAGVVDVNDKTAFIAAARMCQWDREKDCSGVLVAIQLR